MLRQTFEPTESLGNYLNALHARETPVMQALREYTQTLGEAAQMQIDPVQGQIMAWLLRSIGARHVVEIGTFTGYSALWLASGITAEGSITCCDINSEWTNIAQAYWAEAGETRISLRLQPAIDTLKQLHIAVRRFDAVFIDADKGNYQTYFDLALPLVRKGGLIMLDNVLWHGEVADAHHPKLVVQTMRHINEYVMQHAQCDATLLPIGDGLLIARKR